MMDPLKFFQIFCCLLGVLYVLYQVYNIRHSSSVSKLVFSTTKSHHIEFYISLQCSDVLFFDLAIKYFIILIYLCSLAVISYSIGRFLNFFLLFYIFFCCATEKCVSMKRIILLTMYKKNAICINKCTFICGCLKYYLI